ncbi:MAG: hypothetical protein IJV69_02605 [Kiritimatiellae bacterium]|nr:hypothetical protein [Kiritimatiellia bacterium]
MESWKQELEDIFLSDSLASRAERENAQFAKFLREVATPALKQIAEEMRRLGRMANVREAPASTILTVYRNGGNVEEICYSVTRRFVNDGILPMAHARVVRTNSRTTTHEEPYRPEGSVYTLEDVTADEVIRSFLTFYRMTKGQ